MKIKLFRGWELRISLEKWVPMPVRIPTAQDLNWALQFQQQASSFGTLELLQQQQANMMQQYPTAQPAELNKS